MARRDAAVANLKARPEKTAARSMSAPRGAVVEHYDEPVYYGHVYERRIEDVAFYRSLCQQIVGPVLELGAGNGRVALALATDGKDVTCVDRSKPMLDDLTKRLASFPAATRRHVRVVPGDMRSVRLRRRFDLVIAPFNVVLHLYTHDDLHRFLETAALHLNPGGRLVFDYSMPRVEDLALDPTKWIGAPRFRHPETGKLVKYAERFVYDAWTQVLRMTLRFTPVDGSPPWQTELLHRQWFPCEMEAALGKGPFDDVTFLGDFEPRPATSASDSVVVTCSLKAKKRS